MILSQEIFFVPEQYSIQKWFPFLDPVWIMEKITDTVYRIVYKVQLWSDKTFYCWNQDM